MLMAKLFQELKRHDKFEFELVFLVMDPGYLDENRKLIESNAKMLGVPITIFESDIFDVVDTVDVGSPCYLCARMRRGFLYRKLYWETEFGECQVLLSRVETSK